jgi:hypothetical protein
MMVTKMTKSIWVGCIALAASMFLTACSDESPFSKAEDDLDDIRDEANNDYDDKENEKVKCRYGESSHSDEWCCDYYGYKCSYDLSSSSYRSSSSSRNGSAYDDDAAAFLYRAFSVEIDLTWFKQLTDNWEKQNKHKGDYSDGDPGISFVIKTYADYSLKDSVKTEMFKLEDVGTWTGHQYFTKEFSGGADEIYICPMVVERNMIELNVDHTSYYCYIIEDAGKNVNKPIDQSDYMASDFELEWTVRISYN